MSDGGADRGISLLFDVFVLHQRVRSLLARALSETVYERPSAGLRARWTWPRRVITRR